MLRATPVHSLQIGACSSERPFALLKRLPASGPPFQSQSSWPIPSAHRPDLTEPARSLRSSAPFRLAPNSANSTRATRCPVPSERPRLFFDCPLPLGAFAPLPIKAFSRLPAERLTKSKRPISFAPRYLHFLIDQQRIDVPDATTLPLGPVSLPSPLPDPGPGRACSGLASAYGDHRNVLIERSSASRPAFRQVCLCSYLCLLCFEILS